MKVTKILVGVDGSANAFESVSIAAQIAAKFGAKLALVHVIDVRGVISYEGVATLDLASLQRENINALFAAATRHASACPPSERFMLQGSPGLEVCSCAKDWGADLIVVGSHGRTGVPRLLLGSTAELVVRHAPCPVLVIPVPHEQARPAVAASAVTSRA